MADQFANSQSHAGTLMPKKKTMPRRTTGVYAYRDFDMVVRGFRLILKGLGAEQSEHTAQTAERAAKAWWHELCAGLTGPEPRIATFPGSGSNSMIVLRDIPIHSMCAHHLLPFFGTATIGYLPGGERELGLSKLSRIADYWARRPQVQERLTAQIADAVAKLVEVHENIICPDDRAHSLGWKGGVGVLIEANHLCMQMRGVKHKGRMLTSALRGVFLEPEVRAEFLRLAEG